ncbi:MAG: valine--tRNA ligase [Candidatus Kaiserbacteria bacterium]|nr:valine--tRNA ligase [Candidatus Kaiserbacteria bacterium]
MTTQPAIPEIFLSPYNHTAHEASIYALWEKSGFFNPDHLPGERQEAYTVIMPPPNANGALHAGHALFVTLEDMMVRYQRMRGKKVLWVPGADHAGFETQVVYEKKLAKEKRSRFTMSSEELYAEILAFTQENKSHMEGQLRSLGASCDWSRLLFTLDDRVKEQVYATFAQLEKDGLLYRDLRSVHWCPKHQTGFSELELEHQERKDPFYYFQYGPFVIGTVRPETKFADKYVVVHPDDARYAGYTHGQKVPVDWIHGRIEATVIKDEAGDPEKGTGAMTITPWHSKVDWEIAQRHGLDVVQIIDERGKLLPIAGAFAGMNGMDARGKIVEKMGKMGLLVRTDEEYSHTVSVCYKCGREIEPQLKKQWFITMEPLAKRAIAAIKGGEVSFVTERHQRVALHWLLQLQDWNISRQIAWGIPIPAKICTQCDHGVVDIDDTITQCQKCGGVVEQDPDTFDTWFSSGQWPFITLGYPDGKDYRDFYPTSIMETGNDILFFWVVRMLMLGLYRTGTVPFKEVYLHGLVRDSKGEKMSKSKGNVIDPTEVAKEYGTDAMRMAYIVGNVPGEHINFSLDKIRGYKKFANKVWNIGRFVLTETAGCTYVTDLTEQDREHKNLFDRLLQEITGDMEEHRYHLAAEKLYHYIWHTFADSIIEESKGILSGDDAHAKQSRQSLLLYLYTVSLKALHPFMPFITETIWQHIPEGVWKDAELLMVARMDGFS